MSTQEVGQLSRNYHIIPSHYPGVCRLYWREKTDTWKPRCCRFLPLVFSGDASSQQNGPHTRGGPSGGPRQTKGRNKVLLTGIRYLVLDVWCLVFDVEIFSTRVRVYKQTTKGPTLYRVAQNHVPPPPSKGRPPGSPLGYPHPLTPA